jgi:hypothetical protein
MMASVYLMQAGQDLDASPKRMIITGMKRLVPLSSLAALFCVFAALCSVSRAEAAAIVGAGGFKSPQAYDGMTLAWREEFNGRALEQTGWVLESGNAELRDGYLLMTEGGSAIVQPAEKRSLRIGRIDVRARTSSGLAPLVWLMQAAGSARSRPAVQRIDVMQLTGLPGEESTVHGTVHWREASGERYESASAALPSGSFGDQFHVFSVVWDEKGIHWLVDGMEYGVFEPTDADMGTFSAAFGLGIRLETAGSGASPDPFFAIDYIRAFEFK